MNCVVCGTVMDPALAPEVSHPSCSSTSMLFDEDTPDPFNDRLKQELIEVILWAEREAPRSKQLRIGPSEVGHPCDRHLAYKLAGVEHINIAFDPWPATVGTAVHAWLERAFNAYQDEFLIPLEQRWFTETTLLIDDWIEGHADLYRNGTVIDWKTAGPDVMRKVRKEGPPTHYIIQAQIYGLGFERLGLPVERVVLAFLPRSGWLGNMYVWSAPYSRELAEAALGRVLSIAQAAVDMDVSNQPHRWNQLPAMTTDMCGWCPWFNSLRTLEDGASDKGCPGA